MLAEIPRSTTNANRPLPTRIGKFRIDRLRWPSERRTFWLSIGVIALVTFFFTTVSWGALVLLASLALVLAWTFARVLHAGLVGSAVRVSMRQAPKMGQLFEECAWRLRPRQVQGFVAQSPVLNAYAFGLTSPQAIIVYSALVEHLDEDELRFVIGHEMGHIVFNHTRVNSVIGGLAGVPGIPLVSLLAALAFLGWSRCAEYSADRAGLIACGRLDKAQSAIVKLMIGPKLAGMVTVEELEKQADDLRFNPLGWLGQMGHRHPFSVYRLSELRKFAESKEYWQAIETLAKEAEQ